MTTATFHQTEAASSSLLLKIGCGSLIECYVTAGAVSGFLMLFDAIEPPAVGPVSPRHCIAIGAGTTGGVYEFSTPEPYVTGILAMFSSTGPFVLTPSATAFIKGVTF